MERINEELIDLGAASVETQGQGGQAIELGFPVKGPGISDE